MHKRFNIWFSIFTIIGLLLGLVGPRHQPIYAMPSARPLAQVEPDDYLRLSWNILASGHSDRTDGITRDVQTRRVEIRGSALIRVPKEEAGDTLIYQVEVSGAPQDIEPADNLLEIEQTLELPEHDASMLLSMSGTTAPGLLSAGEEVTYTLAYGNHSSEVAANSAISLSLWSGLEFVSATPAPTRSATSSAFAGGVQV